VRIGHDRGRVGVDQHDRVIFFAERLARLRDGIVELTGLADDDGAGADDENLSQITTFRHRSVRMVRGAQFLGYILWAQGRSPRGGTIGENPGATATQPSPLGILPFSSASPIG